MKTILAGCVVISAFTATCHGGLIHRYSFSNDATDSVGGANGTLIGGASVSNGMLLLDGVDDIVQFGTKIVPTSGSYSVALFAREDFPTNWYVELISQGFSTGPGFFIGRDPSGFARVSDSWLSTGVPFPSDGQFHHFAVTVDATAGNSMLYVDGVLSATLGRAIVTTTSGTDTRFGRQFDGALEFFGGALDEVRIYDHALAESEVASLAIVPEPSSLALGIAGVTGLLLRGRIRRGVASMRSPAL